MSSRFKIVAGVTFLIALVFAIPAYAGGWAVITLDELPTSVISGEPLTIGFTVLQHGRTPMDGLEPTITASLSGGEKFTVNAQPEGMTGHYSASLTFPKEGDWEWSIQAFSMDQPMPVLTVAPSIAGSAKEPLGESVPTPSMPFVWLVRILAFGIGLAGLAITLRRKSRLALALTGFCLVVGAGSWVVGAAVPEVEAESKSSSNVAVASSISQVELGERLFIAKGCVTCHRNGKVSDSGDYWTIDMGAPDLTKFSASPEVLRLRLKDPVLVKSDTKMPNLNLDAVEIEALIEFINSK